uniref:Glabrous enhancer-binding protein-like DBD domain-containing protein n=1 Tax=Oryza meridionalis TaxID=40149 RepID=A0A0E0EP97_9ORYZ
MAPTIPPAAEEEEEEEGPAREKSRRREKWPLSDQVKILTALSAHREAGEELPSGRALLDEVKQQLSRERFTARDLDKKVCHLRDRYLDLIYKPPPARRRPHQHHTTLFDLSRKVWPQFQHPPQAPVHISSHGADSASGPIVISSDDSSGHIVISSKAAAAMARTVPLASPTPTIVIISSSSSWTSSSSSTTSTGSVSVGGDEEATSRLRRGPYRCWAVDDEIKIIDTIAALRRDNRGQMPYAAVLLRALQAADPPLLRRGLDAATLSHKVYSLKIKFRSTAMAAATNAGKKRLRNKRNKALYHHSKKAWPEELRQAKATAANNIQVRRLRTSYGGTRVGFSSLSSISPHQST